MSPRLRVSTLSVGETFGYLTLVIHIPQSGASGSWLCRCKCGNSVVAKERDLRRKSARSCGCGRVAINREMRRTHGLSKHPDFAVWTAMIARCHHPQHPRFKDYGGRGITVCERWRESPVNFFSDMGPRPKDYTIERRDNNAGYSPDNCLWTPRTEQSKNQRTTLFLTHNGETLHMAEWARRTGLGQGRISWRLRNGWSVEQALTITPRYGNNVTRPKGDTRKRQYKGEQVGTAKLTSADVFSIRASTESLTVLARRHNVGKTTIARIRHRTSWKHL